MRRLVLVGAAAAAVVVAVAAVALRGGDEPASEHRAGDPSRCRGLVDATGRSCYRTELVAFVGARDDPRPAVQSVSDTAWRERGFLLANCHGLMHTVGRTYAREHGVTLATLKDYLPRSNDPGCAAGFAHGLVTGVAPKRPDDAAAVCADAGTRYQRYSCVHGLGHAFMRSNGDELGPALALCTELGPDAAPDCAQGAYHDYWFAVTGADDASLPGEPVTSPRALCGAQPRAYVRPCWYRAFVENRPAGFEVESAEDLDVLCGGLAGEQRAGCIAGAAVIGPADPALQLEICAALAPADAASCVRGTKVQNLLREPRSAYADLIRRCERLPGAARPACYRWLGKALAVVTDGTFRCSTLAHAARRECEVGAASREEALVTFS